MATGSLQTLYTEKLNVATTVFDFTMPTAINTPVVVSVTNTAIFDVGGYVYVRNPLGTKYGIFKITALTIDTISLSLDSLSHKSGTGTMALGSKITPSAKPASGTGVWGDIDGTLSDQTDLQNALDAKFDEPTGTTSQYIRGDGSLAAFNIYGSFFATSPTVKNIPLFTATRATTINELRGIKTASGTATISIQVGGVDVTGLTNLSITSSPQNFTATGGNTVSVGTRVTVNITAVSSATDLEFTMGATLN